jgi:hypothetical protein
MPTNDAIALRADDRMNRFMDVDTRCYGTNEGGAEALQGCGTG